MSSHLQLVVSSSSGSCESQREASLLNYYYGSEPPHYIFTHLVQHILLLLSISPTLTAIIIFSLAISFAYSTVFNSSYSFRAIILASAFCSFTSNSIFSFSQSQCPDVMGLLFLTSSFSSSTSCSNCTFSRLNLSISEVSPDGPNAASFTALYKEAFSPLNFYSSSALDLAF